MPLLWHSNKEKIYNKWKKIWFDITPYEYAKYSWDYCFEGGKQIRPTLFCELWSYLSPDYEINYELAFAIECIHVSSLILDDLPSMDNAETRRNKKTLHLQFSRKENVSV